MAQLCLTLLTSVATLHKDSLAIFLPTILPCVLELVRSPLLQGGALKAMQNLFEAVVTVGVPGLSYKELLNQLLMPFASQSASLLHKQVRIV